MLRGSLLRLLRICSAKRDLVCVKQNKLSLVNGAKSYHDLSDDEGDRPIYEEPDKSKDVSSPISTKSVSESTIRKFKSVYDESQQIFLIDAFNNASLHTLSGTKRSGSLKAKKIINFREDIGGFNDLGDLLKVPGVGLAGVNDICRTLLSHEDKDEDASVSEPPPDSTEKQPRAFVSPHLTSEQREELQSIITFVVSFEHVTFAKINRELQVEQWRPIPLFDTFVSKLDHTLLYERIQQALEELPDADIFLREDQHYRFQSLKSVPILANMKTLEAVFTYALNSKYDRNVVHSMKSSYRDRMFKLRVGKETVSGKPVVMDIFRKKLTGKNEFFNDVEIPSEFMDDYLKEKSVQQDKLTRSLLQGLAFYKSVIYKK